MHFRTRALCLSACFSIAALAPVHAQDIAPAPEPARLNVPAGVVPGAVVPAQQVADAIAARLRQCPGLRGYQIDITFQRGVAELTGEVADAAQRREVEQLALSVPGVTRVENRLGVRVGSSVVQAQVLQPPPIEPPPAPKKDWIGPEPTPLHVGPPPGTNPNAYYPPRMPPYAWPTYAPYNNYSRVAYPTVYPYQAWPFIGPMYPFPKVPLGWRSVSLTWQDGFWWYGRNATGQQWWQVRFW